jgi:hypothetical protein
VASAIALLRAKYRDFTFLYIVWFFLADLLNPPGAIPDPIDATLNQDVAIETIARWSGLFLRTSILNDKDAFNYVYSTGDAADPNVTVESKRVPESASIASLEILFAYFTITQLRKRINQSKRHFKSNA